MANDTDMWLDIENLEHQGMKKQAQDLLEVFRSIYIENTNKAEREEILQRYIERYNYDPT
jgi:hypothetical protein